MGDACGFSRKQADGSDRLSTSRGTLSTYPLPLPAPPGSGDSNTGPSSTRALRAHACLPHWMSPRAPGLFTVHTDPLLKPWVWCRRLLESGGSGRAAAGHLPPGLAPRASLHEFSESGVGVGEGVPALGRACSPTALCSAAGLWCPSTPAAPGTGVGAGGQRDGSRYCGFKGPKPTSDLISTPSLFVGAARRGAICMMGDGRGALP